MPNAPRHHRLVRWSLRLLPAIGILLALFGVALDWLPGANPGLGAPQLTLIIVGIALSLVSIALSSRPLTDALRKNLKSCLAVAAVTLAALELLLTAIGMPTWFPPDVPRTFLQPAPWWTCDAAGCHYVKSEVIKACERGELSGRRCIINRQGFHDTQDFDAVNAADARQRILVLGDSFAFGGSAALGKSFVEAVEADYPAALVWNTGIPGAGAPQAIASYQAFSPLLRPQLAIFGFYMNDFDDNMLPIDSYFMGVDAAGKTLAIRQYQETTTGEARMLARQSDLYYRWHRVDPPTNDLHRVIGETRLGTLLLRFVDAISQWLDNADGGRLERQATATRVLLRELSALTARDGVDLLLLLIPAKEDTRCARPHVAGGDCGYRERTRARRRSIR